jgi:hypothetical protein
VLEGTGFAAGDSPEKDALTVALIERIAKLKFLSVNFSPDLLKY